MPSDNNKIAQSLTVEQLDQFVTELAALPGKQRTLEQIRHKAAQLGIMISIGSAKSFRDTTFDRHLEKIRLAQSIASQVEAIEQGGNTMADASAKLLSKRIFNQLIEAEDDDSATEIDVDTLSLAVSRLRRGNQLGQMLALAQEKWTFDAAKLVAENLPALKGIAQDRTLSDDQRVQQVRLKLWGPVPASMEGKA